MPRLTAPFLLSRPINYSPLSLREIDLRSSSIPNIENLMVLLDQLDSYDLTDNDVQIFENMPVLKRCKEISLANNTITKIQPDLAARLPSLTILNLSTNSLKSLASIVPLLSLNTLTHLDLTNNACCNKKILPLTPHRFPHQPPRFRLRASHRRRARQIQRLHEVQDRRGAAG